MTPELAESVRLVQHAGVDLNRYVDEQLATNPLLDRTRPDHTDPRATPLDSWSDTGALWARPQREAPPFPADIEADGPSLRDHLAEQARVDLAAGDQATAALLIDRTDSNGYLDDYDAVEIAELGRTTVADVERVLGCLQTFDPPGVCARSLAECLRLQLQGRTQAPPKLDLLIDHLDLVAARSERKLCNALDVSADELRDLLRALRSLNPKPGAAYGDEREFLGAPDIIATPDGDDWRIELNPACFPRIYADRAGYREARAQMRSTPDDGTLTRKWQEAAWLVRALRQRAQSIYRVASVLIRLQDRYVRSGVEQRRPLTLRQVADMVDLHESTVSRVVANKSMATPRGTLPLRSFFDRSLGGADGRAPHSPGAVRAQILALVNAEGPEQPPYSDQQIVDVLAESGIQVARRTVAKYRSMLQIPTSAQRQRTLRDHAGGPRQQAPFAH